MFVVWKEKRKNPKQLVTNGAPTVIVHIKNVSSVSNK